jgi:2-polyprenyl-3-methyl-5-hydroxy-6-metoxy-1,4-benzoquinol methylase
MAAINKTANTEGTYYMQEEYYDKIKKFNVVHYGGEVSYYSVADLRPAEEKFLSQLPAGAKILDIGCGSGRFSINAAKQGFDVTGVDITPEAIAACKARAAKEKLPNAKFEVLDITEKVPAETYDYVFCPRFVINAISTDTRRRAAINNMYAVCKPGGTIFVESFNLWYMGTGPIVPIANIFRSASRWAAIAFCKLTNKKYNGLLPGDITYPANKAKGASDGYAHLPTIFEVKSYLKSGRTTSIHEVIGRKNKDWLKPFRYSIWTTDVVPAEK